MNIVAEILDRYLTAQKEMIEAESVDERNAIVSLPLHFSAHTRIELSVTQITKDQFLISDMANTIGELMEAGYAVTTTVRQRILELAQMARLELTGNTLSRTCSQSELGSAIHEFGEAAKTVGDAYLAYPPRTRKTKAEDDLKDMVRETFQRKHYMYKEKQVVSGEIEEHKVDFYIHPNGGKGLVLAVLPDPDKVHAEAWGFRTVDIKKRNNERIIVGVLYDAAMVKDVSRNILDKMADLPVPSSEFESGFVRKLDALGVSRHKA